MYPTRIRASLSLASTGLPNSIASPSVAGRRPVSIFIVVDLPQPLDPRKPKISPRSMVKFTELTAVNFPNRRVRFFATMAGSESVLTRGGMVRLLRVAAFLFRQQGDERGFEVLGARPLLEFFGRTDGEDLPGVHRDEPVEAVGFVHVGGGDEHAHPRPPGPDVVDERPELLPR